MPLNKHIMLIAGEASGEQHAAALVKSLAHHPINWQLSGIGGQQMRAQGVDTFFDCSDLAVMGFTDVLAHLPTIVRIFKATVARLRQSPPDLLVLIDYPGFNLRLAKAAKKLGIKVLFYISPQVWAWRQKRVYKIAKCVDHMAVIFPFEVGFYQRTTLPVTYVGHPLTHSVYSALTTTQAKQQLGFAADDEIIGLFPGSRQREIDRLLPVMLQTAQQLRQQRPNCHFVLPLASTISEDAIKQQLAAYQLDIKCTRGNHYDVVQATDAIIIASGTATLEAALLLKPMVIIYKVPYFTALLLKRLIKIPYIGLANIVAEQSAVPELLQKEANAKAICQTIERMLDDDNYRQSIIEKLHQVKQKLGQENGSDNVAKIIINLIKPA